jgi:hypothetical protein
VFICELSSPGGTTWSYWSRTAEASQINSPEPSFYPKGKIDQKIALHSIG